LTGFPCKGKWANGIPSDIIVHLRWLQVAISACELVGKPLDAAPSMWCEKRCSLSVKLSVFEETKMSEPTGVARDQLRTIVERVERLEEEKKAIADDIKEVYGEAKANGFDTKTLRTVVRLRKQEMAERQEQEALLDLYLHALGMVPDTEG